MNIYALTAFVAAGLALSLAMLLVMRRQANASHRDLASLCAATGLANVANGIGLLDDAWALSARQVAMAAELIQPALVLYSGLAFVEPGPRSDTQSGLWRARVVGLVGLALAMTMATTSWFQWRVMDNGGAAVSVMAGGQVLFVFIVVGMALGLAQLEVVLRAGREPARHQLKFIVIGLAGLAGYQVYQASQWLLFAAWHAEQVLMAGAVTIMSLGLMALGLGRSRLQQVFVHAYVSQQALFGSVTFVVIGGYLIVVGAVGTWLRQTNQPLAIGLSVVVVVAALVGLLIAVFSKTVRADLRRFLVRNFYRSKYDYRAQWLRVTEAFQQAATKEAILDRLLDLLINTFATTMIAIWSYREADRRFVPIRSMTADKVAPIEMDHPVIAQLMAQDEAVLTADALVMGRTAAPDPLAASGAALCFPIRAQGRLIAFMALGKQRGGEFYGTDDCDLLKGMAHHVGALLSHAKLAEERRASAELEALHRFSVFCLHDLKNLAARLSLVAQNAEQHGQDPSFQASAMRTVADTSKKMALLMSKLSLKSVKPLWSGPQQLIDLTSLVYEIIAPLQRESGVQFQVCGDPPSPVMGVREQLHQVLLNVILNAKQALGAQGDIVITLDQGEAFVVVTVTDNGPGIAPAQLEVLFQPAQSSRPGGLGVGLYQCKQMVEAHRGTIHIRSELGQGTQVRIELPRAPQSGEPSSESVTPAVSPMNV